MIDIGQTITILANVGVIAGVAFLAFELRQNNALLAAQTRAIRQEFRVDYYAAPINNRDVADALIKRAEGKNLSKYEGLLLDRLAAITIANLQFVYGEYKRGLLKESDIPFDNWAAVFDGRNAARRGYWTEVSEYWEANKELEFDRDFVDFVDRKLLKH